MGSYIKSLCILTLLSAYAKVDATAGRSSIDGDEKPARNFYGTITDRDEVSFAAEYIAIGSKTMTGNIPVYQEPKDSSTDPRHNTIYLNLDGIKSISTQTDPQKPLRFANQDYTLITVIFRNEPTREHTYIIESRTKIWCNEITEKNTIPREIRVAALSTLAISGYRSADTHPEKPTTKILPPERSAEMDILCTKASQELKALEETVQSDSALTQQVRTIQDTVIGGICSR